MKKFFILVFASILANTSFSQRLSDYHKPNFENKHFDTRSVKAQNSLLDNYDVKFYKIDLNVTNTSKTISGNATVYAQVVTNPMSTLVLELINSLLNAGIYFVNCKNENNILPVKFVKISK
ncbi:MAG: hypothetical protein COX07_02775 [Bacteroidetes bacterium CG23_combo_of_CG06-09_8_20_14_all_32_9]|nr:MAG: hypothetical protein COX07_02775 [Bacteroidetes bacterium CG23_combo_of_CG06-09_8_20_14_all_32_9]